MELLSFSIMGGSAITGINGFKFMVKTDDEGWKSYSFIPLIKHKKAKITYQNDRVELSLDDQKLRGDNIHLVRFYPNGNIHFYGNDGLEVIWREGAGLCRVSIPHGNDLIRTRLHGERDDFRQILDMFMEDFRQQFIDRF